MARITVEDCIDKFPSRFELVLVASSRARKLHSGEEPTVEIDNDKNYDPSRNRKLLVTKKEFNKISGSIKQGGFTIIPLSLYFSEKGLAKLSCGIAKGKKKIDKRESIKQRDWNIKKQRLLKNN